ncbi:microviridin/marinostatin family tricyclic proteinase inhibitor [Flavobacterium sp. H122]|uniref:microviridin/marinostatin family tricyclic proteinase inhibitor n=1 Tax=Flavobacterium sp. H122 TaxID=2529860 RepID=UPI0010AA8542|nr:microviridin/marinostatin family tricyclic proteinase inhibitor [Flavobacterium sp. H122]
MKKNENAKKPFFANFLENQISKDEQNAVQGGITTVLKDNAQTMKYPSDSDEAYESLITKPIYDDAQTMKYPSDSDEDYTEI